MYRDRISGFEGTCTGKAQYISGCDQVLLTPPVGKEGELRDSAWFDDERLHTLNDVPVDRTSRKGGPEHAPTGRH